MKIGWHFLVIRIPVSKGRFDDFEDFGWIFF